MHSFEELREQFTNYLKDYNFPTKPAALYNACRHILSIGGKRVRPVLCLLAADAVSEINDDAYKAAMAVELFHNFSLVHDDIMDKADIRRGQPTVHKKYSMPTAILAGDVLNVFTYALLNELESDNKKEIITLFNKTAIEVCEGQQMDMDFEERDEVLIEEYLRMIELKTSVLLASSLKLGALIAKASESDAEHLYNFGRNVGLAFQIKDDYLDAFGDGEKTGKKVGGDIVANKKTIFYCYCMQEASDEIKKEINNLQEYYEDDKVSKTLAIYEQLGAREYVYKLKDEYSQKAFDALEQMTIPAERLAQLRILASYLLQREY